MIKVTKDNIKKYFPVILQFAKEQNIPLHPLFSSTRNMFATYIRFDQNDQLVEMRIGRQSCCVTNLNTCNANVISKL